MTRYDMFVDQTYTAVGEPSPDGEWVKFADVEPLAALLRESKHRHHHNDDDTWYCCGKCDYCLREYGEHPSSHRADARSGRVQGVCDCGADAWNARVDALLARCGLPAAGPRQGGPA